MLEANQVTLHQIHVLLLLASNERLLLFCSFVRRSSGFFWLQRWAKNNKWPREQKKFCWGFQSAGVRFSFCRDERRPSCCCNLESSKQFVRVLRSCIFFFSIVLSLTHTLTRAHTHKRAHADSNTPTQTEREQEKAREREWKLQKWDKSWYLIFLCSST